MSLGLEKRSTLRTFYNELRPWADALDHPIVIYAAAIEYGERRMVSRGKHHGDLSISCICYMTFFHSLSLSLSLSSSLVFFLSNPI